MSIDGVDSDVVGAGDAEGKFSGVPTGGSEGELPGCLIVGLFVSTVGDPGVGFNCVGDAVGVKTVGGSVDEDVGGIVGDWGARLIG